MLDYSFAGAVTPSVAWQFDSDMICQVITPFVTSEQSLFIPNSSFYAKTGQSTAGCGLMFSASHLALSKESESLQWRSQIFKGTKHFRLNLVQKDVQDIQNISICCDHAVIKNTVLAFNISFSADIIAFMNSSNKLIHDIYVILSERVGKMIFPTIKEDIKEEQLDV